MGHNRRKSPAIRAQTTTRHPGAGRKGGASADQESAIARAIGIAGTKTKARARATATAMKRPRRMRDRHPRAGSPKRRGNSATSNEKRKRENAKRPPSKRQLRSNPRASWKSRQRGLDFFAKGSEAFSSLRRMSSS